MTASGGEQAKLAEVVEWQRREADRLRAEAAARSVTDLARGMLMERLGCTAAEASQQLAHLAAATRTSTVELAAEITGQQPVAAPGPLSWRTGLARAAVELAPDAAAMAAALLTEVLSTEGATAVAIWLLAPDGGVELAGEAGFGPAEASRWRRIPPGMPLPSVQAAHGTATWWPDGQPGPGSIPLIGHPGYARAILPLQHHGASTGALEICWPAALSEFSPALRRQLATAAELCAQTLNAPGNPQPGSPAAHPLTWIFGLLDSLHVPALFAQGIRGHDGAITGLMVHWVSQRCHDPAGRPATALTGHRLLELYPEAATPGGLYDQAITVLEDGEPRQLHTVPFTGSNGSLALDVHIARLFDGVVITWQDAGETERLATLLQQAQWLGQIGSWEENLITGETHWMPATFALFGQPSSTPIRLADLDRWVVPEDVPAVRAFRDRLISRRESAAATFRITRADDETRRQLRAFAQPVTSPTGDLIAIRGAYQDTSTRYHTQVALNLTSEQLASTQQQAEQEHELAMRLQQAITPQASQPAEAAGLDVAARYRPAGLRHMVGGDWYDTVLLPTKQVLLAVGDIAGHGLDAVTGMVALRNYLRGLAITGAGPATLLGWLNSATCHLTDTTLATAICGIYDPPTRTLRWAHAGHLPPLLVRHGSTSPLPAPRGTMLGLDPDTTYHETSNTLEFGDTLLLFTDGLIERRDQALDESLHTLAELASQPTSSISALADHLITGTAANTGDDACLLAITIQ